MYEARIKIIKVILIPFITGAISGVGTYLVKDSQIERLSRESQGKEHTISELTNNISDLNSQLYSYANKNVVLTNTYDSLLSVHTILEEKYKKCISTEGLTEVVGSIDMQKHEEKLKTGDCLKFSLTSSFFVINFIRVSKDGPIISLAGCSNYLTNNEVQITEAGITHYVLKQDWPLIIRFTPRSCESDENIDPETFEEIILTVSSYNIDEQSFMITYFRKFTI